MPSAKDTSQDVIEVEGEIIDVPSELTQAEAWLATTSSKVEELASQYGTRKIVDAESYKDIKTSRTALRKDIASIEQERKDLTRVIEERVAAFKTDAANVLAPLTEIDTGYKMQLDEWEAGIINRRKANLSEMYSDMAPALAEGLVPFERIWATFAQEKKWTLKSTNEAKCLKDLEKVVEHIAEDETTIQNTSMTDEERRSCRAMYFSTLDLGKAIKAVAEQRAQQERLRELDEMRAQQAQSIIQPAPVREPEPEAEPEQQEQESAQDTTPTTAPEPIRQAPESPQGTVETPQPAYSYTFVFELTRPQLEALMAFCKTNDIHGRRILNAS